MNAGEALGKATALLAGALFVALAVLLWIGPGALTTYPLPMRVVFGLLLVVYGGWRARRAWRHAGVGPEN
jgi:hypothetical protein